ncbi:hypothetical protein GPK34_00665 [Secundilactobacillus kimchicus]|uniref:phage holin, LLH family n=1 Tax=Secundilactobacillus kimchicus TaxID=528209 RepID=UPI001C014AD2|nr:phage holin, LLH family [Secundilactobacillus kimchicus]MBT9670550.1 hypothetical protein [Secundilactobacillus kimchicus]
MVVLEYIAKVIKFFNDNQEAFATLLFLLVGLYTKYSKLFRNLLEKTKIGKNNASLEFLAKQADNAVRSLANSLELPNADKREKAAAFISDQLSKHGVKDIDADEIYAAVETAYQKLVASNPEFKQKQDEYTAGAQNALEESQANLETLPDVDENADGVEVTSDTTTEAPQPAPESDPQPETAEPAKVEPDKVQVEPAPVELAKTPEETKKPSVEDVLKALSDLSEQVGELTKGGDK